MPENEREEAEEEDGERISHNAHERIIEMCL
jgi:hypothetical protein